MTKEELAAKLDGRGYRSEITQEEEEQAKAAGLVVVFGASDDLMEFRGAIYDEVGCYEGGTASINRKGLIENGCDNDDCPCYLDKIEKAAKVEAIWGETGYTWIYKTDIPHATFEIEREGSKVMGEKYCRGIVFSVSSIEEAGI